MFHEILVEGKFLGVSEVQRNDVLSLIFTVDLTMNLISESYHECERHEHNSSYFRST